jgi:steroid delta-isomerase-like uncharacterized protein
MGALSELARKSIDAFNARDWDRMASYRTPNSVYDEVSTGRHLTGHAEILEAMTGWTRAFTDLKGIVSNTLEQDDTVVVEVTWTGTHDGPLEGPYGTIPPSGKTVTTRSIEVFRCINQQIVEARHYFDMLNMLMQMGVVPREISRSAGA